MVFVILKSMPVMLLLFSTNPQFFVHNKSSSNLQLIKGKTRDLQKLVLEVGTKVGSRSSALSMNVLLIFDKHYLSGALFSNVTPFYVIS